jgi:hypothetical protein
MASTGGVKLGSTYDQVRTQKMAAEAQIAEIELAKVRGELVTAEEVVTAWIDVVGAVKAKLLSIPTKAAPILANEESAGGCQIILEDLINEALEELANYDPETNPTSTSSGSLEEGDDDLPPSATPKRKPVGRPRKTARLTK